jgi:hypothetical protein
MSRTKESTARTTGALRTFRVPGLEGETGRVVLKVDNKPVYAIDVESGMATLTTAAEGPARVSTNFDSQDAVDEIIEGRLHPIVAALQNRFTRPEGDRRFGLAVVLALRASAPMFTEERP